VRLFSKRSNTGASDSLLLTGYESEDRLQLRTPDWESDAVDVHGGIAAALAWIGASDRLVEVIEVRGRSGSVVAVVSAKGTEWIES
jgi:hypothetical protein